jgi:hypothetical protein
MFAGVPNAHQVNYLFQRYVSRSVVYRREWFDYKLSQAGSHWRAWQRFREGRVPGVVLEIGTGWFPVVAVGLALGGSETIRSVDKIGLLRPREVTITVRACVEALDDGRMQACVPELDPRRVATLRRLAGYETVTPAALEELGIVWDVGDARDLALTSESVDFFISNNTFEHISGDILAAILREYRRLASPSALMSHFVDMTDHYSYGDPKIGPLHFLRYSDRQWRRWDNAIVPQNRLRLGDHRALLEGAGFTILEEDRVWTAPPGALEKLKVAMEFRHHPPEELLVHGVWFTAAPRTRGLAP